MKKYRTVTYSNKIEVCEVERETDKSVWIKGRRNDKITEFNRFHDSFEEAKQHLIDRHEKNIKRHRDEIHRSESELGTIRKMVEADCKPARDFY